MYGMVGLTATLYSCTQVHAEPHEMIHVMMTTSDISSMRK